LERPERASVLNSVAVERLERSFTLNLEPVRQAQGFWNDWNRGNGKLGGQVERFERLEPLERLGTVGTAIFLIVVTLDVKKKFYGVTRSVTLM
jgi:hypothetical protein